jgi:hypothetical protein
MAGKRLPHLYARALTLSAALLIGGGTLMWATTLSAKAAATLVQGTAAIADTATLNSNATSGNLLVVICSSNDNVTITGPAGYTPIVNESGTMSQAMFYKKAVGNEQTIGCTFSGGATNAVQILEYSGVHQYMTLEGSSSNSGTGTAITSGNVNILHANDLLVAAAISNQQNPINWSSPFTLRSHNEKNSGGGKASRIAVATADNSVSATGTYNAAATTGNEAWRGQIVAFRAMSASPSLGVDMVDGSGNGVASPSVTTTSFSKGFTCQTPTGTLGTATQKIRINNTTDNPAWTLAIAASSGPTARWVSGSNSYDFNDASGSPAGCTNGQLSINPSVSTITPQTNCQSTGVAKGAASAFSQGTTDSISIATANSPAFIDCYWDITGINLSQKVPANQPSGDYNINLTLTLTAN